MSRILLKEAFLLDLATILSPEGRIYDDLREEQGIVENDNFFATPGVNIKNLEESQVARFDENTPPLLVGLAPTPSRAAISTVLTARQVARPRLQPKPKPSPSRPVPVAPPPPKTNTDPDGFLRVYEANEVDFIVDQTWRLIVDIVDHLTLDQPVHAKRFAKKVASRNPRD